MTRKRKSNDNPNIVTHDKRTKNLSAREQVFGGSLFFRAQMTPLLSNADLVNLSGTSKTLNCFTQPEVMQLQEKTQKLLQHVLFGEQEQALAMVKANPELLLIKSKAVDHSGRTIIATTFQAAIGAGDKPMWEMMLPYMEPSDWLCAKTNDYL